ncbi:MAG TPA: HD domain-containing phosphohydrolase [Tepidisphaeraceae bacterium]|jgi:putative two-component system response regulator
MQIVILDDDNLMLRVLEQTLRRMGHAPITTRTGQQALERLSQGDVHLVITDWEMPGMNGLEFCKAVRNQDINGYVYVIMLTGREGVRSKIEGLDAGADDFLNKPFNPDELLVCLKTAERILSLETRDLALFAMAKLAESRDPETGAHLDRVQSYARVIARNLSPEVKSRHGVDDAYLRLVHQTSPLHDIGKVGVPDHILLKPGKLTPEEFEQMKIHTLIGAQTLDAALERFPNARFLQMARDIAATHHEKFDGSGYPRGLKGEEIPLCGRIVALADVYDALTSRRVYKPAFTHEEARNIILKERGKHFDPDLIDAFLIAEDQIITVRQRLSDSHQPQTLSTAPAETLHAIHRDPIDYSLILDRCAGNAAFASSLIDRFRAQAIAEVQILTSAQRNNKIDDLLLHAHAIQNLSATISAETPAQIAQQIHDLAASNELAGIPQLIDQLAKEISRIVVWLNSRHPFHSVAA